MDHEEARHLSTGPVTALPVAQATVLPSPA